MSRALKNFVNKIQAVYGSSPSHPTAEIVQTEIANSYKTSIKEDIVEIYISANGNDNNNGFDQSTPIQTLEKGFEMLEEYGFSSVHFYFLTASDFYMYNHKNVCGCSIHFHTRADGVNLHIVNGNTATKSDYNYTAFYGNHYNFGNTRTTKDITGSGDDFNIAQKMNVIFHSDVRGSYFEGSTVIFNACRIYQNDYTHLNSSNFYDYPCPHNCFTGFFGCASVQFNQCWIYDKLYFQESKVLIKNTDFYIRSDSEAFIQARNSEVTFWMDGSGTVGDYTSKWEGAQGYYQFRFNHNIIGTNNFHNITNGAIYALGSTINFYNGVGAFIAGAGSGGLAYVNRFLTLRNALLTCDTRDYSGHGSPVTQLNKYNALTTAGNWQNCSTFNGDYQNNKVGNLGV